MTQHLCKAVEAAARAYCHDDGECPCATPGDCHLWQGHYAEMAIAIDAFFKALPAGAAPEWAKDVRHILKRDAEP